MNKYQIARDKANERAGLYLTAHNSELTTNTQYPPLKAAFDGKMNEIEKAKQKQFDQVAPITGDKAELREKLIDTVYPLSATAMVQATNLGETALVLALDHTVYYFSKASDEELVGRATDITAVMAANLGILTDITAGDITDMETAIADFDAVREKPQSEIKKKKAEGTDPIPGLLDEIDAVKHTIGKLMEAAFPGLYPTWKTEIKVGTPIGVRSTRLVVQYFDGSSDSELKGVKATITNGTITEEKLSTKKGFVRFYSLDGGTYLLTSELKNYVTDVKTKVGIDEDYITRMEVRMQNVIPTGTLSVTVFDKDSGAALGGAHVVVNELMYDGTTNAYGKVSKAEIPPATYQGVVQMTAYKNMGFTFTIEEGKTISLEFMMEKV